MDGRQHQLDRRNHCYRGEGLVEGGQGENIFPEQRRDANRTMAAPSR
jgi:hypothetical protein